MSVRAGDRPRDRATTTAPAPVFKPIPFKPHRGWFAVLVALNVLWIGGLIAMYFTTVRNAPPSAADRAQREVQRELQGELDDLSATTRPGADGSPSAPR